MAVYVFVEQWAELRQYLKGAWHEVAQERMDGAVAANISKLAIGIVIVYSKRWWSSHRPWYESGNPTAVSHNCFIPSSIYIFQLVYVNVDV